MAFFPLVLDTSNGNQIKEIPNNSELSLSGVELSGLTNLTISNSFSGSSITTTGNANIGNDAIIGGGANVTGNLSAATLNVTSISTLDDVTVSGTLTVDSKNVADYLIQSDWNQSNPFEPDFIRNKPDLGFQVEEINDLIDVQADPTNPAIADPNRLVLGWDAGGGAWIAANPSGGVTLGDFSVTNEDGEPGGSGNLVYDGAGAFTFSRPDVPRTLADLGVTNNVNADNFAETAFPLRLFASTSITNTDGRIGIAVTQDDVNGDTVTLTFNDPGYLTVESDTLDTVVGRGNATNLDISTGAITANSIDAQATQLAPNNIGYSEGVELNLTADLTSTNGNVTMTNGNITATNGTITGNIITATDEFSGDRLNAASAELVLNGSKVTVEPNHFKITPNVTLPSSPTVGDITHNGDSAAIYVTDKDSGGNAGWVWLGGPFAPEGIILPNKTNAERNAMTAVLGMMILNIDSAEVQVYNGSTWITVGP